MTHIQTLGGLSQAALDSTYARLVGVQPTRTTDGAVVAGSHNPVDATSGNRTVTLADAASAGLLVAVSKKDASANTVAVSVAHLRDGGPGSITLVGQYEALLLTSKADGTWWPVGDHKTKAYLDAAYKTPTDNLRNLSDSTFLTGLNNAFVPRTDAPSSSTLLQHKAPYRITPPNKAPARIGQTGHGWTGGADDTTVHLFGDRSYKGTTNGAGGSLYLTAPTLTAQDWSGNAIRLYLRVDDPTRILSGGIQVYVTTGTGNVFVAQVNADFVANTWHVITLPRARFTVSAGTPTWAGVTGIQVRFQDKSAGGYSAWTHGLDLLPDYSTLYPSGVFILECDDGYASQKSLLLPLCEALGVPLTLNSIAERIIPGTFGWTVADLQAMVANGHAVGCHAYAQAFHDNTSATAAQALTDFTAQQRWLDGNGLGYGSMEYACCPGTGSPVTDATKLQYLRQRFRSVRTSSGFVETVIPGDPHRMRSVLFTGNTNAQLQTNIDQAAGAGGVFILAIHEVLAGSTNGTASSLPAIAVNNLSTILTYAAGKGMVFRTRSDIMALR